MQSNMESKANGALMRITPLAVWAHQLPQEQLVQTVRADAQLTHPNQTCQVTADTTCLNLQFPTKFTTCNAYQDAYG